MQNLKAIIFDMDLTLLNSIDSVIEVFQMVGKKYYNMDIPSEKIRSLWGKPTSEVIPMAFDYVDTLEILEDRLLQTREEKGMVIPAFIGAVDLVESLSSKYVLGILTSVSKKIALTHVPKAGFDVDKFYFIQGIDDTDFHKPDPKVFEPALAKLKSKNINKDETLYVGDGIFDYQAANGAGLNFVAVTTGLHTKEEFLSLGLEEEFIISSIVELSTLLNV